MCAIFLLVINNGLIFYRLATIYPLRTNGRTDTSCHRRAL